jgi:nitrogen fixation/metabolism regulation signal transduction histidine kinase
MIALTASMGIAYADMDIAGTLQSWFSKKTDNAIVSLEQSMQAELALQQASLKQELQERLAASSRELDDFTEEQRAAYIAAIQQHAADLLENVQIDNAEDRQQIQAKLDLIASSAMEAMNSLMSSYAPPAPTFTPTETPAPAPANEQPTSTPAVSLEATSAPEASEAPASTPAPSSDSGSPATETEAPIEP